MSAERGDPVQIAAQIFRQRYPEAQIIFLAGSTVRKEANASSDLDLIVVFEKLPRAYRESFYFQGWPVEAHVHDLETLKYFFFDELPSGNPPTLCMVAEGVEVPGPTTLSQSLKQAARNLLDAGPPPLSKAEDERARYIITSIAGDLRHSRSKDEMIASGTLLYEKVAYYYFRTRRLWAYSGKLLPRSLYKADAGFAAEFCAAFAELFNGQAERVLRLVEELLAPRGGLLFDGYSYAAPPNWRRPITSRKQPPGS
jgi:Nucleotidyltransferase domain